MVRKLSYSLLANLGLFGVTSAEPVEGTHARLELIAESETIVAGESFDLAVHFEMEPHWHIYWKNPGASGLAPEITWELPEGFEAGEIQFPTPERIEMVGLMSYAYEDLATFIVPIQAPANLELGQEIRIGAELFFLICKDVCLPGDASLSIELLVGEASKVSTDASLFANARASQPSEELPFLVSMTGVRDKKMFLGISADQMRADSALPESLYFYAEEEGLIDANAVQPYSFGDGFAELELSLDWGYRPGSNPVITGVLQSAAGSWQVSLGGDIEDMDLESFVRPEAVDPSSSGEGLEQRLMSLGLGGWLILAFLGGLILNIMPCVLPVLSIKVFSLLNHGGQSRAQSLAHGSAYTLGVVASFLVLAGILFGLRALGDSVGWGFQLQNPGFVLVLTLVFFLFGLNLLGVFEVGTGLVGADTKVAGRKDLLGSFGVGVLAAVVGAPCVGPLVGGVSGVALQTNMATGLAIFGMMGFGMASPFLLLAAFPKLVAYLPRPGNWMVVFKQSMGFLLMASVVFLVYLIGQLAGLEAITATLIVLFFGAMAAWVFGTWAALHRNARSKGISRLFTLVLISISLAYGLPAVKVAYDASFERTIAATETDSWKPWSSEAVQAALNGGRPAFVDFTATWCLICQVNKKAALRTDATMALFEEHNVATFSADWTRYDDAITKELEKYGRLGVPFYLLHHPNGEVRVLPQNLTNGVVKEAVELFL